MLKAEDRAPARVPVRISVKRFVGGIEVDQQDAETLVAVPSTDQLGVFVLIQHAGYIDRHEGLLYRFGERRGRGYTLEPRRFGGARACGLRS